MNSYWLLFSQVGQSLPVLLTCAVLTILLTILVCALGFPRERPWAQGGVKAFLNFDRLIVAPIVKFLSVLVAVGLVVFLIGGLVHFCASAASSGLASYMDAGQWVLLVLVALVALVVLEIATRLFFELAMLSVKLVENVIAIRRRLDEGAELRAYAPVDAAAPANPDPAAPAGTAATGAGMGGASAATWYGEAGQQDAYAAGWAQQGGYAAHADRVAAYPPEPVAVARAPQPPAGWQDDASYEGQDAAYAYGQDEGAYAPYADAYDDVAQAGYDGASYEGAYDDAAPADHGAAPTPTTVMAPSAGSTTSLPSSGGQAQDVTDAGSWDCACGARGNVGNFCGQCGSPRPQGDRS